MSTDILGSKSYWLTYPSAPGGNECLACDILVLSSFAAVACLTMLSFAGTEFVVVEDVSCFDTNAIILKGTTVLTYKPRFVDRPFSGSLFGIEVRNLCVNQNTTCSAQE